MATDFSVGFAEAPGRESWSSAPRRPPAVVSRFSRSSSVFRSVAVW